jgi:multiple sugar transport system ATP-binding protein
MNFMAGTLEEGMLRTSLGEFRLSDRLRREVESSGTGREVIVGLRPENFEDVRLVPPHNRPHGITFRATIDVLESLGSDVFVYFTREVGKGVSSAELEELARDSGRTDSGEGGETIVARLDAATRIAEGQDAELWVDSRAMHVFDPATGRNLSLAGDGDSDGGPATVQTASAASGADAVQPDAAQPEAVQPETVDPNATATDIRAVPGQAGQAGQAGEAT